MHYHLIPPLKYIGKCTQNLNPTGKRVWLKRTSLALPVDKQQEESEGLMATIINREKGLSDRLL